MYQPALNLLALSYRAVFTIVGGYLTAMAAPHSPMRHVLIGACIGLVIGAAGVVAAASIGGLGPMWYSVAVAVTGPPCNVLGGAIYGRQMSVNSGRRATIGAADERGRCASGLFARAVLFEVHVQTAPGARRNSPGTRRAMSGAVSPLLVTGEGRDVSNR